MLTIRDLLSPIDCINSMSGYLNINIEDPSSKTVKRSIASDYYLRKVKLHSIISIAEAASIIRERKRREPCFCVQLRVVHPEYRYISCYVVIRGGVNIPEVSGATKSPASYRRSEMRCTSWVLIRFKLDSSNGGFFTTTIDMQ